MDAEQEQHTVEVPVVDPVELDTSTAADNMENLFGDTGEATERPDSVGPTVAAGDDDNAPPAAEMEPPGSSCGGAASSTEMETHCPSVVVTESEGGLESRLVVQQSLDVDNGLHSAPSSSSLAGPVPVDALAAEPSTSVVRGPNVHHTPPILASISPPGCSILLYCCLAKLSQNFV